MKKRLLVWMHVILILLLFLPGYLAAQNRTLTGRVTDGKDGTPIPGVSVQPKSAISGGVITDADGRFKISVGP